jgi:hypothetical protein
MSPSQETPNYSVINLKCIHFLKALNNFRSLPFRLRFTVAFKVARLIFSIVSCSGARFMVCTVRLRCCRAMFAAFIPFLLSMRENPCSFNMSSRIFEGIRNSTIVLRSSFWASYSSIEQSISLTWVQSMVIGMPIKIDGLSPIIIGYSLIRTLEKETAVFFLEDFFPRAIRSDGCFGLSFYLSSYCLTVQSDNWSVDQLAIAKSCLGLPTRLCTQNLRIGCKLHVMGSWTDVIQVHI